MESNEQSKKDQLSGRINEFVDMVIGLAEKEGKLDYLTIEITNHEGNLQMNYILKDRKKVY